LLSFLTKGVASFASSSSSAVPDELAAAAVVIEPYAAADVDATVITKTYNSLNLLKLFRFLSSLLTITS